MAQVRRIVKWLPNRNDKVELTKRPNVEIEKKEPEKTVENAAPKGQETPVQKNKKSKKNQAMTKEQIEKAVEMADELSNVKVLKKDRGLIERTESSKVILTEDNRQVLMD